MVEPPPPILVRLGRRDDTEYLYLPLDLSCSGPEWAQAVRAAGVRA